MENFETDYRTIGTPPLKPSYLLYQIMQYFVQRHGSKVYFSCVAVKKGRTRSGELAFDRRCPTEGCSKLHRRPTADTDGSVVVCSSCRQSVHLRERLERVRECERLYAEGIDAMEQQEPERALNLLLETAAKFHRVASPPHKDTHLAEIAASACMAQDGNVYRPEISP